METKFYQLTNPQKSIWYTEKFFENTNINNICVSGIIYENVNIEALKRAIYCLVKENDSFRIRLSIKNDIPMQFISEFAPFEIETLYAENKDAFRKIEEQMVNEIFSILNSDLFKFKIVIFSDNSVGIILNVHHIIADSWSLGITIQKLIQIYHCILNNEEFSQENPSYLNYVQKEIDYKKSEKYEKDKLYWNKIFDSIPGIASIPSIEGKTAISSYKANRLSFNFDKKILDKISVFCKSNNFSIFNFFMSIISIYIGRVSNLDDFVIGTPILNRVNLLEKHTTGMFVNTVPVRVTLKHNYSFIDFLKYISENMFGILKHQKYSYNSILDDIRAKFPNTPNLYNIMFSYQLTKALDSNLGNYETNWFFNNCNQNDISIHIHDINDTGDLVINYDYLIDKYSAQEIENIHKRIIHIISQIMDNNAIVLNDIEIVTPEEKKQLLYDFNNTFMPYPKDQTILDLFEEQVIKTPDNIAIVFEDQKMTYKELNEKANSLAHHLRFEKNIHRNELVGIMVNRSLEMIISILAVLKSGAAYIPIDPTYPKDRVNYMLKNSNANILLTQKSLQNKIDFRNILLIDLENTYIYNINTNNLEHINQANDTSYVIFTSGSTGNPKGVVLNHKALFNLTNYCNHYIEYLKASTNMAIVSITTISFDIFIFETIISLQKGLKLIIASENEQNSPQLLDQLIEKYDIKIIQSTPSRMQTFLNNKDDMPFLANLDYIVLAGEQLPLSLVQELSTLCSATIYNGYGPSETTVFSTLTKMSTSKITIGKPLDNTQIYILDNNLNVLPIGNIGELYISGDGVGKGYLNNKELTNKVFINNPFINNSIMYKTGDIGFFNSKGEIICLGRSDNQVKLRGLRIELGEIENKINELSFINSCAVIKQTDSFHEYLCAYFTSNKNVKNEEIIEHISKYLPKYMIPKYYIQIPKMPYTPNGKIDRTALCNINCNSQSKDLILPRNTTDIKLIKILKQILHIENISINDDFFDLGGDSLSAITLSSYIQKEFKTSMYVKDILNNSKICELSDYISNNSLPIITTIKPISKKEYYEVSSAQKRILLASKVGGTNSVLYNIPGGITFDKDLDLIKLEKCINTIIMRQESLRTYFELENDSVVQKIVDTLDFKLDIIDNVNYENIDSIFNTFVKPFDLSIAPLFRIKYLKFTNGKNAIFIDMHHIISDGTSLSIFIDELISLYNDISLPELKITYKDYSAYEFNKLHNGDLNEAKEYWLNQFSDEIPILNMPTNFPRPSVQSFVGKKIYSIINSETFTKISDLCSSLGITPYMFLLSCYYILLSKYTSQDDIVIGSPIVGRDIVETYNLIGMFVNTLALRNKIDLSSTFKDFTLNVKETLLNAYKYQTYPFDELVRNLNLSRDASRKPLFDTMFTYQNNGYKSIEIDGIKAEYYIPDTNIAKFDLSVEAVPQDDKINLTFEYSTDLFTEEFIKKMSNHYLNIINTVLNNINLQISNISMLSENEKNRILYEFNNTYKPYPKDKTIVDLFEEQVLKTPDNIAVIFEDEKLTYKELNEKANSLAFYLRYEKNLSRNDFVGIMVNRSLEMIISILAVLKSGAAYIPIDPTYPKDRIDYMLKNSNAKILLTQDSLQYNINFGNKLLIDLANSNIYRFNASNLEHINQADDTSYVIFTSGSTGNPKGVMIKHQNLINFVYGMQEEFCITQYDTIASITTISFDIFVLESLFPLSFGAKIVLANEAEQKSAYDFNLLCLKNNVNVFQTTPSRIQAFLSSTILDFVKQCNRIFIGGEPFPNSLLKKLQSITNASIFNMYGPTETTIWSSLKKLSVSDNITIGAPIINTQIYILDKNFSPVPTYVPGDIYISGDGVGKGYLNNKELTDKVFINNPFVPNSIMYKTGDIGYFNENGEIICLGRSDHQVKIRGLRIELGEIENVIQDYPNITKCVVVKNSANNKEFLSCYYTATKKIELNNLRQYISNYLPKYMLPSYFVALDKIPYTPNGKVDRKQLPVPQDFINIDKNKYIAPETYLQKQLVNMFESVLNIHPIGINDNFFELGGDSLLAITLNIEIQKISQKISYQDIFNNPTVLKLEEKILCTNNELMFKKVENLSENHLEILNNSKNMSKIDKYSPKCVLLIGATGFLGIHILKDLIENESSIVYCLVRNSKITSAEDRLKQKLCFYFGKDYNELFNKRIFVLQGDITQNNLGLCKEELQNISEIIDIVVNTAAIVSHFGIYEKMYNANVKSVANLIDFCKIYNKRLYHISTISVSGLNLDISYLYYNNKHSWLKKDPKIKFDESDLYIGQNLENIYIRTKFEAEDLLLNAIANGLDAYILRMGHLMPRYTDGVFQENVLDNELINKIKTFLDIGYIPNYLLSLPLELTPVDDAAHAILKLLTHPSKNNRIFHLYNPDIITVEKVMKIFSKFNININILNEVDFIAKIQKLLNAPENKNKLKDLFYDFDNDFHLNYNSPIKTLSKFTTKYLRKTGFKWHKNTSNYLYKILAIIRSVL